MFVTWINRINGLYYKSVQIGDMSVLVSEHRMVFMNKVWSLSLIRQKRYRICAFTKNNVGDFPSTHLSFCQIHTQVESRQH